MRSGSHLGWGSRPPPAAEFSWQRNRTGVRDRLESGSIGEEPVGDHALPLPPWWVNWTGVWARLLTDAVGTFFRLGIKTSAHRHADEVLEEARHPPKVEAGVRPPSSAPRPHLLVWSGCESLTLATAGSNPPGVTKDARLSDAPARLRWRSTRLVSGRFRVRLPALALCPCGPGGGAPVSYSGGWRFDSAHGLHGPVV